MTNTTCKIKTTPTNPRDDIGQPHRCHKCKLEKRILYIVVLLLALITFLQFLAGFPTPKTQDTTTVQESSSSLLVTSLTPVVGFSQIQSEPQPVKESLKGETVRTGGVK